MSSAARLTLAVLVGLLLTFSAASRQEAKSVDPLVGVWASETTFGGGLRGDLTVTREASSWRAILSGAESRFQASGDRIRFAFPGNAGQFRGALTERGREIRGFWLQPAGETHDPHDPGGSGQPFASPLVLRRTGRNIWRGTVRPLEDRFTLYLRIFQNAEGALIGAFRNPEMGSHGGSTQYRVTREGATVRFSAPPEIGLDATLASSPDRLQIFWRDVNRVLELTRRTPDEASNFLPRPPGEPAYVYRKPPDSGDGWRTARARDVGMDEAMLARLVQRLIDADPAIRRPALIHSLLVARHGKLVLDEYFFGFDRDQPHDVRSAGKTLASVMLGAIMMQGAQVTPETPVYALLAGMGPFANPDPRKSLITLAHLMTHTSGLCTEDDASPGNEGTMQRQREQPDWWKYTLDLPMEYDPESRYAYCSGGMNLVAAALTTASATWLPELFERTVARPLRFGPYYWNLLPTDEGYLGGGAFIRPRDLLKVGQIYLDGGVWQGRRIVESSWVTRSTAPHIEVSEATTGLDSETFALYYNRGADGYAWQSL